MASGSSSIFPFDNSHAKDQIKKAQPLVIPSKKPRRNCPDPNAEVIALSPTTLMAENRFVCEVCSKGFPREQNLELHKRRHNKPWKLKQKSEEYQNKVKRKVYLCPVSSCLHHDPSYALGDLAGIKKHYSRKHGEKKHKCAKCMKMYAVPSDLKAHMKICGTKEYRCHCDTLFSRRDSFLTHNAFCEALGVESEMKHSPTESNMGVGSLKMTASGNNPRQMGVPVTHSGSLISSIQNLTRNALTSNNTENYSISYMANSKNYEFAKGSNLFSGGTSVYPHASIYSSRSGTNLMPQLSATALLQKAGLIGSTFSNINATNTSQVYVSTSLSDPIGGTTFEMERFLVGSKMCNSSESNEHDNMNVLLNSFSNNGNESLIFTQYPGTTYEQEVSYQDGHGSNSGRYDEHLYAQSTGSSMGFQQSRGITFTQDLFGVGDAIVGETSSYVPPSSFVGQRFL